jgi:alkylmercury lyase
MMSGHPLSTPSRTRARDALLKLTGPGGTFDYGPDRSRLLLRVMRALGQGCPLSANQVDHFIAESGMLPDDAHAFLGEVAERGPDDTLVGVLGLSLRETAHRVTVDGRQLFTWCAADTLFLPSLLGHMASVESESPVSQAHVRLTVSPQRVEAVDPSRAVVSIVVVAPDAADVHSVEALWGTFCRHIFFFAARQEAETWAAGRDDSSSIEIVSVDDAFELSQLVSARLLGQAGER